MIVAAVHGDPSGNYDATIESISNVLTALDYGPQVQVTICGDFNIDQTFRYKNGPEPARKRDARLGLDVWAQAHHFQVVTSDDWLGLPFDLIAGDLENPVPYTRVPQGANTGAAELRS